MIQDSKTVSIFWKTIVSPYAIANKEHVLEVERVIGSAVGAVNKMLSASEEQKAYMPEILGLSPNSPNWDTNLAHYWNSLSVSIPTGGRKLEIGFIYDVNSNNKKQYIDTHNTSSDVKLKTEQDIVDYFSKRHQDIIDGFEKAMRTSLTLNGKAKDEYINNAYRTKWESIEQLEAQKYKFGTPLNVQDYILYRYCLVYGHVANEYSVLDKSSKIRFYLHSEEEMKAMKKQKAQLQKDKLAAFLEVTKNPDTVENLLYAVGLGSVLRGLDKLDLDYELQQYSDDNPKQFIEYSKNKSLPTIGLIEKYIEYNILKRLDNTSVIVDSTSPDIIIGNSMDEAISFFTNEKNKPKVSEYKARFNSMPN